MLVSFKLRKNKYIKILLLQSQKAEAVPPLGTILGNIGVNTVKFCDEFNKYTQDLPFYFIVRVSINISENRSFTFTVHDFSLTFALKLLKFEKKIKIWRFDRFQDEIINCVFLNDLIILLLYKFPNLELKKSFSMLLGTLKSMKLTIAN